jgi:hypothetical protein
VPELAKRHALMADWSVFCKLIVAVVAAIVG